VSSTWQPEPAERGRKDVAADSSRPQRVRLYDGRLQSGLVKVGERPFAVRLQGLLHSKVILGFLVSLFSYSGNFFGVNNDWDFYFNLVFKV